MGHTVVALRVAAGSVVVPGSFFHELGEARGVAFVHQQIARLLPPKDVVRRVGPWRALIGLVAGQKIEEER